MFIFIACLLPGIYWTTPSLYLPHLHFVAKTQQHQCLMLHRVWSYADRLYHGLHEVSAHHRALVRQQVKSCFGPGWSALTWVWEKVRVLSWEMAASSSAHEGQEGKLRSRETGNNTYHCCANCSLSNCLIVTINISELVLVKCDAAYQL